MDDAVRAAERRYRASGALDDEVAWLRERLRAGELTRERCELAAFMGQPAATTALALDCAGHAACLRCSAGPAVMEGLAERGPEANLRAAVAAARWSMKFALSIDRSVFTPSVRALVDAGLEQLRDAADRLVSLAALRVQGRTLPEGELPRVLASLRRLRELDLDVRALRPLVELLRDPERRIDWTEAGLGPWLGKPLLATDRETPPDAEQGRPTLLAAIAAELVSWALGYEDPLLNETPGPGPSGGSRPPSRSPGGGP